VTVITQESTMSILKSRKRRVAAAVAIASAAALGTTAASSAQSSKPDEARFQMFVNRAELNCLKSSDNPRHQPSVDVRVDRGDDNDTMTLRLRDFKPDLQFDLFTVQNSNQNADGSPVAGFTNFGLAWYQSDIHVSHAGTATVRVKTILLDQIFGFDPAVGLNPTNTFHVGFWFNDPADAAACGFTGTTPFNGEHNAGPLAFITRPNATTTLGPLCTDPTTTHGAASCNP
jgi:hypothetical protein